VSSEQASHTTKPSVRIDRDNPGFGFGSFVWLVTSVLLVLGIPSVKVWMGVSGVSTHGTELAI
jgi:hypothetical protein